MSFSNYFWAPRRAFRARRPGCSGVPSRLRDQLPTVAALHIPGAFKKVLRFEYQVLRLLDCKKKLRWKLVKAVQ